MSHFTEIKTKIYSSAMIEQALKSLNIEYERNEQGAKVRGFMGDVIHCEFSLRTQTPYDIGMRRTADGSYEFVADRDMLKAHKFDLESFQGRIMQRCNYYSVKENLEAEGYEIGEEIVDEQGHIQMVVSRW